MGKVINEYFFNGTGNVHFQSEKCDFDMKGSIFKS